LKFGKTQRKKEEAAQKERFIFALDWVCHIEENEDEEGELTFSFSPMIAGI
jgi:hypothetical protein